MHSFLVTKKQADLFWVRDESGKTFSCVARKVLKSDGIFVGDRVILDEDGAICAVEKRKNLLIRPPVANINKMFIVIAPLPKPDLLLVDKLIIFCHLNDIQPILCVNKTDLDAKRCQEIFDVYSKIVLTFVFSTLDESVQKIKRQISGVCVLAGQSAVGKSSIINALLGQEVAKVDTFSKKIERGKQTTRTVQLFCLGKNKFLADTAGFSKLSEALLNLKAEDVRRYYDEFTDFAADCKYKSCLHFSGKDCAVCKAVKEGKISKVRHENYVKLTEAIKLIKKF